MVCFGEMLIDFVPTVGGFSLADAPAFKKAPGGAPANVAVGIAKLGGNAAFVGKVCSAPVPYNSLISLILGTVGSFCDLNLKGSLPMIVAWRSLCEFIDMQSVEQRWS